MLKNTLQRYRLVYSRAVMRCGRSSGSHASSKKASGKLLSEGKVSTHGKEEWGGFVLEMTTLMDDGGGEAPRYVTTPRDTAA